MDSRARIAIGLAGGYLAGRYKKARWVVLGAALLGGGKRLGGDLVQRGVSSLGATPELAKLAEQSRGTAVALLAKPIQGLTGKVHARAETIRASLEEPSAEKGPESEEQPQGEGEAEAEPKGEGEAEAEPKGESEGEGRPQSKAKQQGGGKGAAAKPARKSAAESGSSRRDRPASVSGRPRR